MSRRKIISRRGSSLLRGIIGPFGLGEGVTRPSLRGGIARHNVCTLSHAPLEYLGLRVCRMSIFAQIQHLGSINSLLFSLSLSLSLSLALALSLFSRQVSSQLEY